MFMLSGSSNSMASTIFRRSSVFTCQVLRNGMSNKVHTLIRNQPRSMGIAKTARRSISQLARNERCMMQTKFLQKKVAVCSQCKCSTHSEVDKGRQASAKLALIICHVFNFFRLSGNDKLEKINSGRSYIDMLILNYRSIQTIVKFCLHVCNVHHLCMTF